MIGNINTLAKCKERSDCILNYDWTYLKEPKEGQGKWMATEGDLWKYRGKGTKWGKRKKR